MARPAAGSLASRNLRINVSEHPRLFFTVSDLPRLRAQTLDSHRDLWAALQAFADANLQSTPPPVAPANGTLDDYRNYAGQLIAYAFACVLDDRYCPLAKTFLLVYAKWKQWGENNWRDLGHAHMLLANALAYDWLHDQLTESEHAVVKKSLAEWAQKMYEASAQPRNSEWNNWWSTSYAQNHHWTNHSALGMAGLALLGEDDRASTWIDRASERMTRVQYLLNGIEDGSWHEGMLYQSYGLTLALPFLVNLRRVLGFDLIPHRYLRNYPYWRLYNHLPETYRFILSYGDFEWKWGNGYRPQNLLRFSAREYRDGHAEWLARQIAQADNGPLSVWDAPYAVFEFLYYDATVLPRPPGELPLSRVFPDLFGVIWRTGWSKEDLVFGLKGGAYGARFIFDTFVQQRYPWDAPCQKTGCSLNTGHDHADANTFYLHRGGQWLAPETVGDGKSATAFHNSILVDGEGSYQPSDEHYEDPDNFAGSDGFLQAAASSPHFDYVAANATRSYKNHVDIKEVTRHVLFVRPRYFVILDRLSASEPHQYEWVSHFGGKVSVKGNWVRGDAGNGQTLGVNVVLPESFTATIGDDGHPYVHIRPAVPVSDVNMLHVLYPTDIASWSNKPDVTLLADANGANGKVGLRTQSRDPKAQTVDDIIMAYADPSSIAEVGPYRFDGSVATVTRDTHGNLTRLFVHAGTELKDLVKNQLLVAGLDRSATFEADYTDQSVVVTMDSRAHNTLTLMLYAPNTRHLIVNGSEQPFTQSGDHITFKTQQTLPEINSLPLLRKARLR